MKTEAQAWSALRKAKLAYEYHSQECALWDYTSNNCTECDYHQRAVRAARAELSALSGVKEVLLP